MVTSWIEEARQFKSPLSVVAGFLLRSRETQAQRAKSRTQETRRLKRIISQQQATIDKQQVQLGSKNERISQLERQIGHLHKQPAMLPKDPPLPNHEFGPQMISLCINLARRIGLRAVPDTLKMFFDWLRTYTRIPNWTTIRTWMLRVGVAAIKQPIEQADDWIWMADHSNQIGTEKVLSIIGLRASKMPPRGQPLKHENVRVLELKPGTSWKREDMAAAYKQLSERCGAPLAVLVDGAVELREGLEMAEIKRNNGESPIVQRDFKHFAANVLKQIVGKEERFIEFTTQLGRTRPAVRQTELAHLAPPGPKSKARFMNLAPTLVWAKMVSWQLSHPDSEARCGITANRMNEKLGWLRTFHEDIQRWNRCQKVISTSLKFINEQGVFIGVARELRNRLQAVRGEADPSVQAGDASRQVAARLLRFVRQAELQLDDSHRLPLSTEILESSFGLFKQLERQHSKGGFTSLLATYGCLLHTATPQSIRRDFHSVSVKAARAWVSENLGTTVNSQRQTAYREAKNET